MHSRASLSEASVTAIRHVKDVVKRYGNIQDVPIADKLLNSVSKSHSKYMIAKESERKAAGEIRKRALEEDEAREAKKLKKETGEKIKEIDSKIKHLQKSLRIKDMVDMKIVCTMIKAATSKIQETTQQLSKAHEEKFKLQSSLKA